MKYKEQDTVSDQLRSCDKCRVVWQTATLLVEPYKRGGYSYYQDFPHIYLEKEECPRCKEEANVHEKQEI